MTTPDPQYLTAWLDGYMLGVERGRQEREAEENAAWPPPKVYFLGQWYDRAEQRQKWDAAARVQRPTDIEVRA